VVVLHVRPHVAPCPPVTRSPCDSRLLTGFVIHTKRNTSKLERLLNWNQLRCLTYERQRVVAALYPDVALLNTLLFDVVLKHHVLLREQTLEDHRVSELSTGSGPSIPILRHIYRVVHKTELHIGLYIFEVVPIPLAARSHLIDDVFIHIRNLTRVRLDVGYVVTLLLYVVHQVIHEQRTTLGYDVILVARVSELFVKFSFR